MKNAFIKIVTALFFLAFTGCSSVKFYSNPELTTKSGLKYYTVKPFLQVEREIVSNNIVKTTIIYLPDLANPQYIKLKSGLGSRKFDLKLTDGYISTIGFDADPKIAESVTALAGLVSKTATALKKDTTLKGLPPTLAAATITELYDIIMTNGTTSVKKIEVK
jgi:hypothetical protein